MERFVMVACTFSITVGYPLMEGTSVEGGLDSAGVITDFVFSVPSVNDGPPIGENKNNGAINAATPVITDLLQVKQENDNESRDYVAMTSQMKPGYDVEVTSRRSQQESGSISTKKNDEILPQFSSADDGEMSTEVQGIRGESSPEGEKNFESEAIWTELPLRKLTSASVSNSVDNTNQMDRNVMWIKDFQDHVITGEAEPGSNQGEPNGSSEDSTSGSDNQVNQESKNTSKKLEKPHLVKKETITSSGTEELSSMTKINSSRTEDLSSMMKINSSGTEDLSSMMKINSSGTADLSSMTKISSSGTEDLLSMTKINSSEIEDQMGMTIVYTITSEDHTGVMKINSSGTEDQTEINSTGTKYQLGVTAINSSGTENQSGVTIYDVGVSDEESYKRLYALVHALEALGILDADGEWCYVVEGISKSSQTPQGFPLFQVGISIKAKPLASTTTTPRVEHPPSSQFQTVSVDPGSDVTPGNDSDNASGDFEDCLVNGTGDGKDGKDCIPLVLLGNDTVEPEWANKSLEISKRPSKSFSSQHEDNGILKPSRTQILVISTCSTVIGVFFILALIMRIRNYLKRTRNLNKHRNGVRHHRPTVTSGLPELAAAALPMTRPSSTDVSQKDNNAKQKETRSPRSVRFFRRRRASDRVTSAHPKMPVLRKQGELTRLFVSHRSQREAAKEYIRQLSLSGPQNSLLATGGVTSPEEPQSPLINPQKRPVVNYSPLPLS